MNRALAIVTAAASASLALFAATACSSGDIQKPPALGNCMPSGDAACTTAGAGSGSGARGDAGTGEPGDSGLSSDAGGTCGQAGSLVATSNLSCAPCITGSCCMADQACSSSAACLALLQCIEGCQPGDSPCAGNCENTQPTGVTAYDDFAQCLQTNCSPGCPTLPTQVMNDF